jgi:hypothetical protein
MQMSGQLHTSSNWIAGGMGPSTGLDAVEKRQILPLPGNRIPVVRPVNHRYTDWAIPDIHTDDDKLKCA